MLLSEVIVEVVFVVVVVTVVLIMEFVALLKSKYLPCGQVVVTR